MAFFASNFTVQRNLLQQNLPLKSAFYYIIGLLITFIGFRLKIFLAPARV